MKTDLKGYQISAQLQTIRCEAYGLEMRRQSRSGRDDHDPKFWQSLAEFTDRVRQHTYRLMVRRANLDRYDHRVIAEARDFITNASTLWRRCHSATTGNH